MTWSEIWSCLRVKQSFLGSIIRQWNLLESNVKISLFRNCQKDLVQFFLMEGDLVYCNDIDGLMVALRITHDPDEWRLVIDSSKTSLKAVLLHNGNVLLSIQRETTVQVHKV